MHDERQFPGVVGPIEALLGPGGALERSIVGHETRPSQLVMAQAVEQALADDVPLLIEAGTGTGKTLAYLLPAVRSERRVVISTGTRNLQEQLHRKDVPLVASILGQRVDATVLKGISNYLCRRRLATIGDTRDPALLKILAWARETTSGDRADLPDVQDDAPAWGAVTTSAEGRLGPKCPQYEPCHVTAARRAAASARVVIVNHHLLLADATLRARYPGAAIIPPYDALIIDEAHQLEDVATHHFGVTVSTLRTARLLTDARRTLTGLLVGGDARAEANRLLVELDARIEALWAVVRRHVGAGHDRPAPSQLLAGDGREAWLALDTALEALALHAERVSSATADPTLSAEQEALSGRAEHLRDDLALFAEPAGHHVCWMEQDRQGLLLRGAPIEVGPDLWRALSAHGGALVMTSATLTVGGSFAYSRARVGLAAGDEARELALASPFRFEEQALMYLPRHLPAPGEPGFDEAAQAEIEALLAVTAGRAFVLFTSHRALALAAARLRASQPYPILVQGDGPQPALVERFRATPNAVLLGTSSFWEGVDVPGDALSLVILEKLPFQAPDDPVTAARARALEEDGRDPFREQQLPRAALSLKQGFGRLIRRRDDRGIVAILDNRIVTRGYGNVFLRSLPPARRTSSMEQLRRWWSVTPAC